MHEGRRKREFHRKRCAHVVDAAMTGGLSEKSKEIVQRQSSDSQLCAGWDAQQRVNRARRDLFTAVRCSYSA